MRKLLRRAGDAFDTLEFIGLLLCVPVATYVAWRVHPYLSASSVVAMAVGAFLLARARHSRIGMVGGIVVGLVGVSWLVYLVIYCLC